MTCACGSKEGLSPTSAPREALASAPAHEPLTATSVARALMASAPREKAIPRSFVSRTHAFTSWFGTVTEQYSHGGPMRIAGDGAGSIVVSVEYNQTPGAAAPYGAAVVLYGCVQGGGARTPLATGYATSARMTPVLTVGGMPFDWYEVDLYVQNGTARVIATRSAGGSSQPYARPIVGAEVAPGQFPVITTVPGFPAGAIKWTETQPQATQLSDTDPNPSTTRIGANLLGWDAVNQQWHRVKVLPDGTLASASSTTTDRTATGTIAAAQAAVQINTQGSSVCSVTVTNSGGAWVGTLVFEGSGDGGTTWAALNAIVPATGAEIASTPGNGVWTVAVGGFGLLRVRSSLWTNGTAAIALEASSGAQDVTIANPLPVGTNTIGAVTQSGAWTTAATQSGAWNVGITGALPTGANVIGGVTQSGAWSVGVTGALPTGGNVIGLVGQSGAWSVSLGAAIPAGANVIGGVTQSGTWTIGGIYNAALPVLTNGNAGTLQLDSSGILLVSLARLLAGEDQTNNVMRTSPQARSDASGAWTTATLSMGVNGTVVAKAAAGRVRRVSAFHLGAQSANLYLVDKATAPVATDVIADITGAAANAGITPIDYGAEGRYFANGIAFAQSTVNPTVNGQVPAILASADWIIFIEYA